jgi:hypothetical protein
MSGSSSRKRGKTGWDSMALSNVVSRRYFFFSISETFLPFFCFATNAPELYDGSCSRLRQQTARALLEVVIWRGRISVQASFQRNRLIIVHLEHRASGSWWLKVHSKAFVQDTCTIRERQSSFCGTYEHGSAGETFSLMFRDRTKELCFRFGDHQRHCPGQSSRPGIRASGGIHLLEGHKVGPVDVFFESPTTLVYLLKAKRDLSLRAKDLPDFLQLIKRLLDEMM